MSRPARPRHARPNRTVRRLTVAATTGAAVASGGAMVLSAHPARASTQGDTVVAVASHYAGDPYLYGGTTPAGFDCSGYVQYVFRQVGLTLPRTTNEQYAAVRHVGHDQKEPGDILFLPDSTGSIYHEGIYAGGNSWWVASHTGTVVHLQTVYTSDYLVGRATSTTLPPAAPPGVKPLAAYRGWLMRPGWVHPAVAALQQALGVRPTDGQFGSQTEGALIGYQQRHAIPATGVTDAATWSALLPAPAAGQGVLQLGSTGPAVVALQQALHIPGDGEFGPQTQRAVQAFQSAHGLTPDGVVGPLTRAALGL